MAQKAHSLSPLPGAGRTEEYQMQVDLSPEVDEAVAFRPTLKGLSQGLQIGAASINNQSSGDAQVYAHKGHATKQIVLVPAARTFFAGINTDPSGARSGRNR